MRSIDIVLAFTVLGTTASCATPHSDLDPGGSLAAAPPAAPAPDTTPPPPRTAGGTVARTPIAQAAPAVRVPLDGLPMIGSADALVTIVAFVDYECPYSAKAEATLAALRAELGSELRIVLAERPLPIHPHAPVAARALLAAAEQGKAAEMHARLFADRAALDDAGLAASAQAIGLDVDAFEAARNGSSTADALARSMALARELDVTGTPTFYVNGRRVTGARPYDEFHAVVDEELAKARALVAQGVRRSRVYATLMESASAPPPPSPENTGVATDAVDIRIDGAPVRGVRRAPVTIAVFADFECPYSVRLDATLRELEARYPGKVRVAFRHLPLPMHEHARLAAKAAIAADAQGRFWAYHDVLIEHRDALDRASLRSYASTLGLDLARFDRDLDDPKTEQRVVADELEAAKLHVTGTPISYVNGRRINGAQPLATFRSVVEQALVSR